MGGLFWHETFTFKKEIFFFIEGKNENTSYTKDTNQYLMARKNFSKNLEWSCFVSVSYLYFRKYSILFRVLVKIVIISNWFSKIIGLYNDNVSKLYEYGAIFKWVSRNFSMITVLHILMLRLCLACKKYENLKINGGSQMMFYDSWMSGEIFCT